MITPWTFRELTTKRGKSFVWTSKINPDFKIYVDKYSIMTGIDSITWLMKGTPSYEKYLGWFVRFIKKGELDTIISSSIRARRWITPDIARQWGINVNPGYTKKIYAYYPQNYRGPFLQEHAVAIARYLIKDPAFNAKYITKRDYDLDIPGWELEKKFVGGLGYRWMFKKNGRHLLVLENDWVNNWKLTYLIGYADDPESLKRVTLIKDNIHGISEAVNYTKQYARTLNIPEGNLEHSLKRILNDEFAGKLKQIPDSQLSAMTRLLEQGTYTPEDAIRYIEKYQERKKDEEKKDDKDQPTN